MPNTALGKGIREMRHADRKSFVVSVVLTTYNRAELLPRAINSVLIQSFCDFELIVVDDHSQDGTAEICEAFTDKRIRYVQHTENRGLGAARNTGISLAGGEFIAFLDDDDEWLPSKLEKQVIHFRTVPQSVALVYCWMDCYEGERVVYERHPDLRGNIFRKMLERQPLGNGSTWLVRRWAVEEVGGFDETLCRGIDGDFARRLSLQYEVDFLPEVLVKVHVGHERITSKWDMDGIRYAIRSQEIKLVKFRKELPKYQKQEANILGSIGYYHSLLLDWKECVRFFSKALSKSCRSKKVYAYMLRSLTNLVTKNVV